MRRVRPRFVSLQAAFAKLHLKHPIHERILVGVTDEHGTELFEEIPNADGYHQVIVGFDASIGLAAEDDARREIALFQQLSRAILSCPFSVPDRESVNAALKAWAAANLRAEAD